MSDSKSEYLLGLAIAYVFVAPDWGTYLLPTIGLAVSGLWIIHAVEKRSREEANLKADGRHDSTARR